MYIPVGLGLLTNEEKPFLSSRVRRKKGGRQWCPSHGCEAPCAIKAQRAAAPSEALQPADIKHCEQRLLRGHLCPCDSTDGADAGPDPHTPNRGTDAVSSEQVPQATALPGHHVSRRALKSARPREGTTAALAEDFPAWLCFSTPCSYDEARC